MAGGTIVAYNHFIHSANPGSAAGSTSVDIGGYAFKLAANAAGWCSLPVDNRVSLGLLAGGGAGILSGAFPVVFAGMTGLGLGLGVGGAWKVVKETGYTGSGGPFHHFPGSRVITELRRYRGGRDNFGRRHGQGVYTFAEGVRYEGGWEQGKMHGKGVCTYADGSRYEGGWEQGNRHGQGVETWPDGTSHEGGYVEGRRHGKRVYTWPDGRRYEGGFADGKPHGKGVETERDGTRRELDSASGDRIAP
jgi:hypothetical protein